MNKFLIYYVVIISLISLVTSTTSQHPNFNIATIPTNDCSISNCYHGSCISSDKCLCYNSYAQFPAESTNGLYCEYQRHSQLTILLLEFFFCFGVGHLVAGNVWYGLFKMCLPFIQCMFLCLGSFCKPKEFKGKPMCISIGTAVLFLFFHIYDIISMLRGTYLDGNKVTLSPSF